MKAPRSIYRTAPTAQRCLASHPSRSPWKPDAWRRHPDQERRDVGAGAGPSAQTGEGLDGGAVAAVLGERQGDDDPLYAAYVLMLVLGLRRGELLGLVWEDVDLVEATAWIGWQLQRVNGGGLVRRATKTYASDEPLPLPDICIRALGAPAAGRGTVSLGRAGLA